MKYLDRLRSYYSKDQRWNREVGKQADGVRRKTNSLSLDAWHLAHYIIEHPQRFSKGIAIDLGRFLLMCEKYPAMKDGDPDKTLFLNQYCELEAVAGEVTARTLAATNVQAGFLSSAVGQYIMGLFAITFVFIGALLGSMFLTEPLQFINWYVEENQGITGYIVYFVAEILIDSILLPFYAAGLGTSVYLLRQTQKHLKQRSFDTARIPGHFIRLLLGIVAGGSLVLFPSLWESTLVMTSGVAASSGLQDAVSNSVGVGQGAAAFVIGYAVEVIYSGLDGMKRKMMSKQAKTAA